MKSKHTPGPLFVRQPEKFPFNIEVVNEAGDVVFSERRYAYASGQESVQDVMAGVGFKAADRADVIDANQRQLADAFLRAAAPELLEALNQINDWLLCAAIATPEDMAGSFSDMQKLAESAIAKATGEQQ